MAEIPAIRKKQNTRPQAFKPGVSGNPSGRPKEHKEWRVKLREFLHSKHPQADAFNAKAAGSDTVHSRLDVILRRLEKDDPQFLIEQGFGKATLRVEQTGADGGPIVVLEHAHRMIPNENKND